jgi:transcription antitermination protein NusB
MSKRREGRQTAVQMLYSREFLPPDAEYDAEAFFSLHAAARGVRAHAEGLYREVVAKQAEIDNLLVPILENYTLQRVTAVDRSILRLATYEMFFCLEVPPIVAINEAIEIAKALGAEDSRIFVNGVLDRLKDQLKRPLRTRASGTDEPQPRL